jgi:nucleoside-diphosphate-sugar epimerase
MRVVVTGVTGNVGSGVLRALVDDPAVGEIVGVARRAPTLIVPKVTWVSADVSTHDLGFVAGADAVIHLAWLIQPQRDEELLRRVNVEGTQRVLDAVIRHGVETLVYASSVGAYSPGPKDTPVDESWPTQGIPSSLYSRQKADVERMLDTAARSSTAPRIVRMRTSLVFSERAASEIAGLFLGPLVPVSVIGRHGLPLVPRHPRLVFQATHTDDIGLAYRAALHADLDGPVNIAAAPVVDTAALAELLGARPVGTPAWLLRHGAGLTHALRLQRTSRGWVDLALGVPTMDTQLATERLGWSARRSATDALAELLQGFAARAGSGTAPLAPARRGRLIPLVAISPGTSTSDREATS